MTRILLVSNDNLSAKAIALSLQSSDTLVELISSNQCLIERCREQRIDLIIFLSLSPYFASMNIVDYLRSELSYMPKIYVISHSHSQSTILTLLECGVDQYMTFPLNLYRLRNKVFSLISE